MTSKREKLQYAYVFLTDFVTTGISVVLAWLITDNVFNKLQDYCLLYTSPSPRDA